MHSYVDPDFDRNFGISGPHYKPIDFCVPKWYLSKVNRQTPDPISRYYLRQACIQQTSQWLAFRQDVTQAI